MLRLLPALATLALIPAAASATPALAAKTYAGTTDAGNSITLAVAGKRATVETSVLTSCVKTGGSSGTQAGVEIFRPTRAFALTGTDQTVSEQAPSALFSARTVTMNYHVQAARKGRTVAGKLSVNYSTSDYDVFTMTNTITVCQGSAGFTARRR
jgi:hypothetical protein